MRAHSTERGPSFRTPSLPWARSLVAEGRSEQATGAGRSALTAGAITPKDATQRRGRPPGSSGGPRLQAWSHVGMGSREDWFATPARRPSSASWGSVRPGSVGLTEKPPRESPAALTPVRPRAHVSAPLATPPNHAPRQDVSLTTPPRPRAQALTCQVLEGPAPVNSRPHPHPPRPFTRAFPTGSAQTVFAEPRPCPTSSVPRPGPSLLTARAQTPPHRALLSRHSPSQTPPRRHRPYKAPPSHRPAPLLPPQRRRGLGWSPRCGFCAWLAASAGPGASGLSFPLWLPCVALGLAP